MKPWARRLKKSLHGWDIKHLNAYKQFYVRNYYFLFRLDSSLSLSLSQRNLTLALFRITRSRDPSLKNVCHCTRRCSRSLLKTSKNGGKESDLIEDRATSLLFRTYKTWYFHDFPEKKENSPHENMFLVRLILRSQPLSLWTWNDAARTVEANLD